MSRRLQVFVSSTYLDLKEERQAAVEAILEAKHIPAGMELFAAGNDSQLEVIKRWIDESDVYMLILGHRYGSIESESGKSYTQVEYEHAVATGKPVFAVVMTDDWRIAKQATVKDPDSLTERENNKELKAFRTLVMGRMCKQPDDRKDIKIAVLQALAGFAHDKSLVGWVRGDADDKRQELEKENAGLKGELAAAQRQNTAIEARLAKAKGTEGPDWEATRRFLEATKVNIIDDLAQDRQTQLSAKAKQFYQIASVLNLLRVYRTAFVLGISSQPPNSYDSALFYRVAPHLTTYGLTEEVKLSSPFQAERIRLSEKGRNFLVWLDQRDAEKSAQKS